MAARFCPSCGNRQPEGNFCGACGRAMANTPAASGPPMNAPPPPTVKAPTSPIDSTQQRAVDQLLRELKDKDLLVGKLQGECKELATAVVKHREEVQSQQRTFELKVLEIETKHREAMADFAQKQRQQFEQKLQVVEARQQEAVLHYDKKLTNMLEEDRIRSKKIKALQEDSAALAADRDKLQGEVRSLRAQVQQYKRERDVSKAAADAATSAMRPLTAEVEALQAKLRKAKAENEYMAGHHATELSQSETENASLSAELAKSKKRAVDLLCRVMDLETELVQKTKEVALVNTELQLMAEQCSAVHAEAQAKANVAHARKAQCKAEEALRVMTSDLDVIRRLLLTEEVVNNLRESSLLKRPGTPTDPPAGKRVCHRPESSHTTSPLPPLPGKVLADERAAATKSEAKAFTSAPSSPFPPELPPPSGAPGGVVNNFPIITCSAEVHSGDYIRGATCAELPMEVDTAESTSLVGVTEQQQPEAEDDPTTPSVQWGAGDGVSNQPPEAAPQELIAVACRAEDSVMTEKPDDANHQQEVTARETEGNASSLEVEVDNPGMPPPEESAALDGPPEAAPRDGGDIVAVGWPQEDPPTSPPLPEATTGASDRPLEGDMLQDAAERTAAASRADQEMPPPPLPDEDDDNVPDQQPEDATQDEQRPGGAEEETPANEARVTQAKEDDGVPAMQHRRPKGKPRRGTTARKAHPSP
eukprot:GGOE01055402.1.p1 GENE.GGOE01055402.1~~GGOE01055402.1.p1  ORF type:complete len:705 (+),score=178.59 GGOE01055402.1:98-2212(+)